MTARQKRYIFLCAGLLLLGSCSSGGEKQENILSGDYSLAGDDLNLTVTPPESGATPETIDLDRKLGGETAGTGDVPEFSGVWVGTIASEDEEDEIMIWFKDDGTFIVTDGDEYNWEFDSDGLLSFSDPANPSNPDVPTLPATEAQLESGSFTLTFDEDSETITLEMTSLVANSWTGLWGARTSEVPDALVPPCGYTHMALFEDDGTVWAGEVSTEGTYDTSGSDFTFELTWPPEVNELDDKNVQEIIPADEYLWDSFAVGPGEEHGCATVTISAGTVLWGDTDENDDGDYYGGIVYIRDGGTLIADGVIFQDAQLFYLEDGASLIIRNSTINFGRWSGNRADSSGCDAGIYVGSDTTLTLENNTISARGNVDHLVAAQCNSEWFAMSSRVDITIDGNTITTDGDGAIALADGEITNNTITLTKPSSGVYGIWANKSENPLAGKEGLTLSGNTLTGPGSGRGIVFGYWLDISEHPTEVRDNRFEGFDKGLSSEGNNEFFSGDPLKLYERNLIISGNEFSNTTSEYHPEEEFFHDPQEMGDTEGYTSITGMDPLLPDEMNQLSRALTTGDTDFFEYAFMEQTGTADLTVQFTDVGSDLIMHCSVDEVDYSGSTPTITPSGEHDAPSAGADWSFTISGADRSKSYRFTLTHAEGSKPGNYTIQITE